jgi:hypothetical protein
VGGARSGLAGASCQLTASVESALTAGVVLSCDPELHCLPRMRLPDGGVGMCLGLCAGMTLMLGGALGGQSAGGGAPAVVVCVCTSYASGGGCGVSTC